jgi:quinolinate synthase
MSDLVCTSSNAEKIVNSVPIDVPIIFAPDKNLGRYIHQKTGREMLLWDGSCVVHEAFSLDKLIALHQLHPQAHIIAHPESESHILETARFIGSTSALIDYVKKSTATEFIVATEVGILHKMQQAVPDKKLIPAPSFENNTCACSQCAYMKLNTLQKLYECLQNESPEINIDASIAQNAVIPIKRMLALSKND